MQSVIIFSLFPLVVFHLRIHNVNKRQQQFLIKMYYIYIKRSTYGQSCYATLVKESVGLFFGTHASVLSVTLHDRTC